VIHESILEEVRTRCREVAEQAVWVEIDAASIPAYAASLPPERLLLPEMDPVIHYLGHGADTVAYYLTLDAVNFGSGYFPDIFGARQSGYRAIAAALARRFLSSGPIAAGELRQLSPSECARIFELDTVIPAASELVEHFVRALNELGAFLCDCFHSDFSELVASAGKSAERLVGILSRMTYFRDVQSIEGMEVPFYKRAQLAAVDLFIALGGEGMGEFQDLDSITICADNLVPHVLRHDGVLRYREDLAARIDRREALAAGSREEVEIRACAVQAGELIVAELRRRGEQVNALLLDNLLWHRGQDPFYRARPRHRTRTVFY
jgi:hypothetical protein